MFIDHVKVHVKAGKGEDGTVAFRREKYVTYGGPDGGGDRAGGDVVSMVDKGKITLLDLHYSHKMAVEPDGNGKIKKTYGANGTDRIIKVPQDTLVKGEKTRRTPASLTRKGQKEIIAKDGKGGRDNFHFKPSKNMAPQCSELGAPREERNIMVELKVLTDVRLTSFPSIRKSTLLSVVSEARPEVAEYHFTTPAPNLEMVQAPDDRSFVMTDLSGLIKGVGKGRGLGHQFLCHIERRRVTIHIVDMGTNNGRDPAADCRTIGDELKQYEHRLMERPQITLVNKMDLDGTQESLERFRKAYPEVKVFETTTIAAESLEPVLYYTTDLLETTPQFPLHNDDVNDEEVEGVLYKFESEQPASEVYNIGNGNQELNEEELERSFKMSRTGNEEDLIRSTRKMRKTGVDGTLRKASCKDGDVVTTCGIQFEFVE